jgi:hypothetical protein
MFGQWQVPRGCFFLDELKLLAFDLGSHSNGENIKVTYLNTDASPDGVPKGIFKDIIRNEKKKY